MPGAIHDQELVLEEERLRNYGTGATRSEQAGQGGDEVDEKNDQIAHHRIVAGRGILRNLGRNNNSPATGTVSDAEIYNPNTGTWTTTGRLNVSRADAATLLLENGEVLSAGGYNNTGNNNPNTYLTSAELYDPSTGTWSFTSSISGNVGLPTTPVLLTNGDVLVANDAEFYNPNTGTWLATGVGHQNVPSTGKRSWAVKDTQISDMAFNLASEWSG